MEAAMCSQVKKSFFKPVLPDSFQQLAIPETFHSEFVGEKCETGEAILRNHQHKEKVWHVKMEGFNFHQGWNYFVRDLDVRIGDYLMFRHEGGFVFDVLVFDNTGSEKHYQHFDDKMEDKTGEKKDSSSRENAENSKITEVSPRSGVSKKARSVFDTFKFSVTSKNLKSGILEIPRAFVRSCGMEDKIFKIVLKDEKETTWSVNLNRDGLKGRIFMASGWRDFIAAHKLTAGDTCSFKLINSRIRYNRNELVLDVTINRKGSVKDNEQFKPTNSSCFEFTVLPYIIQGFPLHIPAEIVRLNDLGGRNCDVEVRDKKGKLWKMKMVYMKRNSCEVYIRGEWIEFFSENSLEKGNTCMFEVIFKKTMQVVELQLL